MERSSVIPFIFKLRYITSHPEAGITLRTDYVVHGNKFPQSKNLKFITRPNSTRGRFFMLSHDGTGITGPQH